MLVLPLGYLSHTNFLKMVHHLFHQLLILHHLGVFGLKASLHLIDY